MQIDYSIIAIDLPSHNKSDEFPNLSLDLYVDIVKKLIDSLEIKDLILAGHSLGGAIIQDYYFKYPNDVSALILCATGGRLRVSPLIFSSLKNNFQEFLKNLKIGAFSKHTKEEIKNTLIEETAQINPSVIYMDFQICDNFDTLEKTGSIAVPCLIICGEEDRLTPIKYSKFFHDKIINSKLSIIKKAGHIVMLEKPREVNEAIKDFINNYKKQT